MKQATFNKKTQEIEIKFTAEKDDFYQILNQVKSLESRVFNPTTKIWTTPLIQSNIDKLKEWGFDVNIDSQDDWQPEWQNIQLKKQPPEYLRSYQIEAMKFLSYRKGRGLISGDMGTGKTIEACGFIKMLNKFPVLIVVPASIKRQWYNQFKRFVGDFSIDIIYGQTTYKLTKNTSYIINYELLQYWQEELKNHGFTTLIADESHMLGSNTAKRVKATKNILKNIDYFIPMSGTPIKSSPLQFFPVLQMIDKKTFNNEYKFKMRYCNPKHNGFGWTFKGASNTEELHKIVREYMIRHTKESVLKDLPEKQISVIPLELTGDNSRYLDSLESFKTSSGIGADKELSNMKIEAFGLKYEYLKKWITDFVNTGNKILIGGYHRTVLETLQKDFKKHSVLIYGGTSAKDRESNIEKFKSDPDCKILFGQILSAGVGIDGLQDVCSNCAFVELADTPADHEQFLSRLHRSGQKDCVNVYYLLAENTIEMDIVSMLDRKTAMFDNIVNGIQTENDTFLSVLKEKYNELQ